MKEAKKLQLVGILLTISALPLFIGILIVSSVGPGIVAVLPSGPETLIINWTEFILVMAFGFIPAMTLIIIGMYLSGKGDKLIFQERRELLAAEFGEEGLKKIDRILGVKKR